MQNHTRMVNAMLSGLSLQTLKAMRNTLDNAIEGRAPVAIDSRRSKQKPPPPSARNAASVAGTGTKSR